MKGDYCCGNDYCDDDDCDGSGDNEIVEATVKQIKELLDRAESFGFSKAQNFPAYRSRNAWENTRDAWVERFLQCTSKHKDYFVCQLLGRHKEHGYRGGSGWFYWNEKGLIK